MPQIREACHVKNHGHTRNQQAVRVFAGLLRHEDNCRWPLDSLFSGVNFRVSGSRQSLHVPWRQRCTAFRQVSEHGLSPTSCGTRSCRRTGGQRRIHQKHIRRTVQQHPQRILRKWTTPASLIIKCRVSFWESLQHSKLPNSLLLHDFGVTLDTSKQTGCSSRQPLLFWNQTEYLTNYNELLPSREIRTNFCSGKI